jgi:NAD-dependent SIR2 family protein deacetylase
VIDRVSFAKLCTAVRDNARVRLFASPKFHERLEAGRLAARRALERRSVRRAVQNSVRPSVILDREALFDEMVVKAVENPVARLDCVGVIITSGYVPREGR